MLFNYTRGPISWPPVLLVINTMASAFQVMPLFKFLPSMSELI